MTPDTAGATTLSRFLDGDMAGAPDASSAAGSVCGGVWSGVL
jgi:hypothetical protein